MEQVRPTLVGAIGRHLSLLLRCRHDGTGLPAKASPALFVLALVSLLMTLVLAFAAPHTSLWKPFVDVGWQVIWVTGIYVAVARRHGCVEVLAGMLLLSIVFSTVRLFGLAMPDPASALVRLVVGVWVFAAQLSLLKRHFERVEAAPKRNLSNPDEEQ